MQFIDLEAQYNHLKEKIDHRIYRVLEHGQYILGPEVYELEEQLASFVGVKHAITCANGTDALTLAMMALGIEKNDAVFVRHSHFCQCGDYFFRSGDSGIC